MPKKQKQKPIQKPKPKPKPKPNQKQSQETEFKGNQITNVSVNVRDTNNPKRLYRPRTAPVARQPSSIGITLQGSGVALPPPPTQQYNELVQQVEALRRQMAQSGSLIQRGATNDLLNRVQATNPFDNIANVVPVATLMRPEGVVEEQVEAATTIDPTESHGFASHEAYDQDWINNIALAQKGQNFDTIATKIGISNEDPETERDIADFDSQADYYQRQLIKNVLGTEDLEDWGETNKQMAEGLQKKIKDKKFRETQLEQQRRKQQRKQQTMEATSQQFKEPFTPSAKPMGRPKKMLPLVDEDTREDYGNAPFIDYR